MTVSGPSLWFRDTLRPTSCDADALACQLPPNLAHTVDAKVLREDPPNMHGQFGISLRPFRQPIWIRFPAGVLLPVSVVRDFETLSGAN